ncbi:hypothetical protein KIW84_015364 [Lathyrus oleraceus]|uniref:Uncharacterized protein n=1 Tax=Pisum sativum TaxID=3888 RepID=A0A9D5H098_PEA|nr:hypothetical protein KIW84_015364 [Pisum sativum]
MHVSTETSGSSYPTATADEPFQTINLSDLVLDFAPLSKIHPPPQKKTTPFISKNVKASGKSSVSKPTIPSEDKTVVEKGSRSKGSEMRNPIKHTGSAENQTEEKRSAINKELRKFVTSVLKEVNSDVFPDVRTSMAKETSPDDDSSGKAEESVCEQIAHERRSKKKVDECVPEQVAHERRSKKKVDHVVNIDDLTSDDEPLTNIVTPGIAKRLQKIEVKVVMFEDSPSKETKRKFGGVKVTPSRSSKGKSPVGPARSWSKVVTPTRKRKATSSSDFEFEVKKDVQDITPVPGPATSKKSVIAQLKETCQELLNSIRSSTTIKIKLENFMKALMEEEEKEAEQGGDENEGADVEDSAGGNDTETDEDK